MKSVIFKQLAYCEGMSLAIQKMLENYLSDW